MRGCWGAAVFVAVVSMAGVAGAQPQETESAPASEETSGTIEPAAPVSEELYAPVEQTVPPSEDLYAPIELGGPETGDPRYQAPERVADTHGDRAPGLFGVSGLDLSLAGRLEGNMHYRVENKSAGPYYNRLEQPDGIARYETTFNVRLEAAMGTFIGIADLDVDLLGYGDDRYGDFEDLLRWERNFPVRLEVNAAFLEATDLLLEGLDLRLGQQLVKFGVGDQFNPTDTLNPEDLENVLLFGKQLSNFMLRVDYGFAETWSVTAVAVPVFRPAILPRSALAGITAVERLPFVDEETRLLLHTERDFARDLLGYPTKVTEIQYRLPKFNVQNMQWYARIGGEILGQDFALSYYYGRTDMPQTIINHSNLTDEEHHCRWPSNECFAGWLNTHVTLAYPRVQVIGLNLAGEVPWVKLGYRVEAGIYVPGQRRAKLTNDELSWLAEAGEYDYITPDGGRPITVEGTPFAKWVVGLDRSFGRHFYVNAMWVHGFADEFGAGDFFHEGTAVRDGGVDPSLSLDDVSRECVLRTAYYPGEQKSGTRCAWEIQRSRLGDYLVLGVDFKFNQGAGLVRLFTIWDLTGYTRRFWVPLAGGDGFLDNENWSFFSEEGFSAVIYPEFNYNFGNGLELGGGTLIQLGKRYTKFGDPAAGGSLVFLRGRYTF